MLALKDTNSAGVAANPYINFVDSSNTRVGYIGIGSTGNSKLYLEGLGGIQTNNPLSVTGNISATNFSGSSSGTNTGDQDLSGYATTSHNHDGSYLDRYTGSSGCNNSSFTTAFTVNGGNLSSSIRFSVQGTSNSVVVQNLIDLVVGHSQDIQIKALSGNYTKLTVKVVSNNNEDFAVEVKHDGSTATTLYYEVFAYGDESVVFTNTHSFTGNSLEKELPYGNYMAGAGGDSGDLEINGIFRGNGSGITGVDAATVDGKNATDFANANHSHSNYITSNANDSASGFYTFTGDATFALDVSFSNSQVKIPDTTDQNPRIMFYRPTGSGANSYPWRLQAGGGGSSSSFYIGTGSNTTNGAETIANKLSISSTGTLTVTGDVVAYGSPSDAKYKENVKPIENALDKVMDLEGVSFDWKENSEVLDIKEDIGFIAQDVQKVIPELVRENEDGNLSLRYQGLIPVLLEAMKEQQKQINELKSQMAVSNKKDCNCKK